MLFDKEHELVKSAIDEISKNVIGQKQLIEDLFTCLLCNGHALIEGAPGLAKTTTAKLLASSIHSKFHRIQFTPDLLPSDLIGSDIFLQQEGKFSFRPGPIFQNIVLADEINRAPAKVQSALLEAMEEKQVTVGNNTYKLEDLFMVIATQNPIEQEGTYPLPEAQLDRFFMHLWVDYPSTSDELNILNLHESGHKQSLMPILNQETIFSARTMIDKVYLDSSLKEYIVSLVQATREPEKYSSELGSLVRFGASPRATLALAKAAKANAWINGQDYVSPANIQITAGNILRHRIIPSFEAEASGINKKDLVNKVISLVAIP
jgi:MoxR-like ATPase